MRWILVEATDRVLPEVDADLADYALRELRGRGIDIRLGTRLEEAGADSAQLSTGERIPTRTIVWTAGVAPHPEPRSRCRCRSTSAAGSTVDEYMRVERHERASGRSATAPRCPTPTRTVAARARRPPSTPFARARPWRHNIAAELGVATGPGRSATAAEAAFVNLGRYKAVGQLGPAAFRGFPAWWMARTYHMSQIPGAARKIRAVADWTVGLPFRRDVAEVGSIGHPRPLRARSTRAAAPTARSATPATIDPCRRRLRLDRRSASASRPGSSVAPKGSSFFIWFWSASCCRCSA